MVTKLLRFLVPLVTAGMLAGCGAISPAKMALPQTLKVESERVIIVGIGGARRGEFRVGDLAGSFTRSATRLALFDALYEGERAMASFTLDERSGQIAARCDMRRRTFNVAALTYESKPMAYTCSFVGDGVSAGRLTLHEEQRALRLQSSRKSRSGEMLLGSAQVQLRSVHELQGTPLTTEAPIGYLFERQGRPIAALELNGSAPVVVLRAQSTADERRSTLLAAVALALLWDPAETHDDN